MYGIKLSFNFEMGAEPLIYKDALVMTQEEYDALTAEEILAIQQERYDNWIAIITTPPVDEPILTTEEVIV